MTSTYPHGTDPRTAQIASLRTLLSCYETLLHLAQRTQCPGAIFPKELPGWNYGPQSIPSPLSREYVSSSADDFMRQLEDDADAAKKNLSLSGFKVPLSWDVGFGITCVASRQHNPGSGRVELHQVDEAALSSACAKIQRALWRLEGSGDPNRMKSPPSVETPLASPLTVYQRIMAAPDKRVTLRELARQVGVKDRTLLTWRRDPRVLKDYPGLGPVPDKTAHRGAGLSLHKAVETFHKFHYLP